MRSRLALPALLLLAPVLLVGCTDSSNGEPPTASTSGSPAPGMSAGSLEMSALCEEMIAEAMSPEEATALAEQRGYSARVGTIDGEPQAVTMDFRVDRFTFEVTDGAVTGCTYG